MKLTSDLYDTGQSGDYQIREEKIIVLEPESRRRVPPRFRSLTTSLTFSIILILNLFLPIAAARANIMWDDQAYHSTSSHSAFRRKLPFFLIFQLQQLSHSQIFVFKFFFWFLFFYRKIVKYFSLKNELIHPKFEKHAFFHSTLDEKKTCTFSSLFLRSRKRRNLVNCH